MRMLLALVLAGLVIVAIAALAACAVNSAKAKRASVRLKEGDRVPDVGAPNQHGVAVRLSQFRGRMVVLYFYPRDQTSGCTQEAHGFTADYDRIRAIGADVIGVSNDDVKSHKSFCDNEALPFPLLADTDKVIANAFGIRSFLGLYQRITFLIDGDGVIRRVFDPVEPARHADEVMAAVAELSRSSHAR
jgi:thioredoxin-dependent peroxiredoxin